MSTNEFKIKVGLNAANSSIELNGQPLPGVRRVSFTLDASKRDFGFLTLEIYGEAIVEGEYVERLVTASAVPDRVQKAKAEAWFDPNEATDGTPV